MKTTAEGTTMKVIGYTRVSTEEQATSGVSLAAQVQKIQAQAVVDELEIVEIIEDAGVSAKSVNRPGLQRALEMLRTGQAQGLMVAKLDRLSRSVVDMGNLVAEYFGNGSKIGAVLHSVSEKIDIRSAGGVLVLNVLMSVAQWEREAIGERTRTALAYKKSQGVRLGAPKSAHLTDDAETVARILELRQTNATLREIAATLTTEGRSTKKGGRWGAETVRQVLARQEAL